MSWNYYECCKFQPLKLNIIYYRKTHGGGMSILYSIGKTAGWIKNSKVSCWWHRRIYKKISVNRTDIIVEAIESYISSQNEEMFYTQIDKSCKEAKAMIAGEIEEVDFG